MPKVGRTWCRVPAVGGSGSGTPTPTCCWENLPRTLTVSSQIYRESLSILWCDHINQELRHRSKKKQKQKQTNTHKNQKNKHFERNLELMNWVELWKIEGNILTQMVNIFELFNTSILFCPCHNHIFSFHLKRNLIPRLSCTKKRADSTDLNA